MINNCNKIKNKKNLKINSKKKLVQKIYQNKNCFK